VKANISHLEAAGGISGIIKTVLCLQHGLIPPQAYFEAPSPHVPWKRTRLKIVTEPTPWPEATERNAGVTALGLVGTNAHIILGEAPGEERPVADSPAADSATRQSHPLLLSARDADALRLLVQRFDDFIATHPDVPLSDLCATAAAGRQHFSHRVVFKAGSLNELSSELREWLNHSSNGRDSIRIAATPRTAWWFSDSIPFQLHGAQNLYHQEAVFRDAIQRLDQRLSAEEPSSEGSTSLQSWLDEDQAQISSDHLSPVQVAAVQLALAELLQSWGVQPDCVLGVGIGQFAAASVAGVLSSEDAIALICRRQRAADLLQQNDADADAILDEFEAYADTLNFYPPNRQLICSLTGEMVPIHRSLGGSYWRQHLTEKPRATIDNFGEADCRLILEFGPPSGIDDSGGERSATDEARHLTLLSQNAELTRSLTETLGQLYVEGVALNHAAVFRGHFGSRIRLPHYPMRKKRYWITEIDQFMGQPDSNAATEAEMPLVQE